MKMTRLEWRYLQRIALDHPYFDTHKLPLTEKEAKAIVEANIKMTGREFVDSIYAKLGMTRPQEEKKRFTWLRSIGELFTVPPIRKIAIIVLVVILMTVFFAATPTGRAIAESAIQYIVSIFEKGLIVYQSDSEVIAVVKECREHMGGSERDVNTDENLIFVQSISEFTNATGKTPFVLPMEAVEQSYHKENDYVKLISIYETTKGRIVVSQTWGADDIITTTVTGYSVYSEDASIYYSIEEEGWVHCIKIVEDSFLNLSSNGAYSLEDLIEFLQND